VTKTGQWFSPGTLISSTNKTGILLKVGLNTIALTLIATSSIYAGHGLLDILT
jgi:hypothetical protein